MFNHGPGMSSIQTVMGAGLSLCANLFALLYLVQSLMILLQHKGTLFTSSFEARYFEPDQIYQHDEHGLQFAIGVVDVTAPKEQNEAKYSLEELYDITIQNVQWSVDGAAEIKKFDLHECSEAELGLVEGDSSFNLPIPDDYQLAL